MDEEPTPASESCDERKAQVEALALSLQQALDEPDPDQEVETTRRVDLVEALGALHHEAAVPVLRAVLRQPRDKQAVAVHRAAADALGRIGSGRAVDDLFTSLFRVPDAPTMSSLPERVKVALIAIGDPARGALLRAFEGTHAEVNELAEGHGLDQDMVRMSAAGVLAWLGPASTAALVERFDTACLDPGDAPPRMLRAFVADALGLIGDPRAVPSLCRCLAGSADPADAYPMTQALGHIGGAQAHACLLRTVRSAEYDVAAVANPSFVHELRWEAGRYAVLTSTPGDVAEVRKTFAAAKPRVRKELARWEPGLALVEECAEDRGCYEAALADGDRPWFVREVAAMRMATLAPGDAEVAAAISGAASVRNPDARATLAWLPSRMLRSSTCEACVAALDRLEDRERNARLAPEYQLAVLRSRYTRAALRPVNPPRCYTR